MRAAERAARWAGAKTKPRKAPTVDPGARGARAQGAPSGSPGSAARVAPGRLEIAFADEHELAELAEALERLARSRNQRGASVVDP